MSVLCGADRWFGTLNARGHYNVSPQGRPTPFSRHPGHPLCEATFLEVAAGLHYSLARTEDGRVFSFGSYSTDVDQKSFVDDTKPELGRNVRIASIATSQHAAFAVDSEGHLWSWPADSGGRLLDTTVAPRIVRGLHLGIVQVAAGHNHVLAVGNQGTLWAWGQNECGQLGLGDRTSRQTPTSVRLAPVISVGAGAVHSLAVSDDGSLFAWGHRNYLGRAPLFLKRDRSCSHGLGAKPAVAVIMRRVYIASTKNKHSCNNRYLSKHLLFHMEQSLIPDTR